MVDSAHCSSSRGKTRLQKRAEEEEEMLNILEKKTLKQMGEKRIIMHTRRCKLKLPVKARCLVLMLTLLEHKGGSKHLIESG